MDVEQLREDVAEGRITPERLCELVVKLLDEVQRSRKRIAQLEKELGRQPTERLDESYSTEAEEQRQQARRKKRTAKPKQRRGRLRTADKIALAKRTERVFPEGVAEADCNLSHTRPVWRLENGQAVLVAYEVYCDAQRRRYGKIPGVLGRSEFGMEIVLAIAYLVYLAGLSFDKVCLVLNFFQQLPLRKSQVDALLNQLSRHWTVEFDRLCALLADSAVVHADETSWSLNSVWAFLSERVRVVFFGVHKDAETLGRVLDPATFAGIMISDDAAVYANFTNSQKCWAHLLRKAIKLTLLEPNNAEYRRFTDRLLEIYRAACRVQQDGRLGDAGRQRRVAALDDELLELCGGVWSAELPPCEGPANDYRLLCEELMRLMLKQQLFVFVTAAPVALPTGESQRVSGTNNEAERSLRAAADARKTGRTSKTLQGARRRTIIVSVLESLRQQLPTFTLSSVIDEILRWSTSGASCFATLLQQLQLPPPRPSLLDRLIPIAP